MQNRIQRNFPKNTYSKADEHVVKTMVMISWKNVLEQYSKVGGIVTHELGTYSTLV